MDDPGQEGKIVAPTAPVISERERDWVEPRELLPPFDDAADAADADCPRCSSLVLATDQWCHNCDLQRREAGTDDQDDQEASRGRQIRADADTGRLQPVVSPHSSTVRPVLKTALKKSNNARRGHITFDDTVNIAAVESFKGLELWWRHDQLTRVRKKKAPLELEQHTVNTDDVDSIELQELGNEEDQDRTGALNLNGCEGLSQRATTEYTAPETPRWHGGTFAPPPHLTDLYGPPPTEQQSSRRRKRDELTPELADKVRRNREAALEKRRRRREQEFNKLDGRLKDSNDPERQPASKRPRAEAATSTFAAAAETPSAAPALSEAQRRLEALRARVRAKSLDAG